jgi:hypothetical protein
MEQALKLSEKCEQPLADARGSESALGVSERLFDRVFQAGRCERGVYG